MRRSPSFLLLILVFAVVIVAGCGGGGTPDPATIVESWSRAINASDDEAAANLFADGATVIQGAQSIRLSAHSQAVSFNASLPCGGKVIEESLDGDEVTATFELTERPGHRCDGAGQTAVAVFRISDGKITLWRQLPVPGSGSDSQVA